MCALGPRVGTKHFTIVPRIHTEGGAERLPDREGGEGVGLEDGLE
jgi:hypothetical protein